MATVTNEYVQSFLPERVILRLFASLSVSRKGDYRQTATNQEQETLVTWAEEAVKEARVIPEFIELVLSGFVQIPDQYKALQTLAQVYQGKLLVDVQDDKVVFTDTHTYLRNNPNALDWMREGHNCNDCENTDCPFHPGKLVELSIPAHLRDKFSNLL